MKTPHSKLCHFSFFNTNLLDNLEQLGRYSTPKSNLFSGKWKTRHVS